VPGRVARWVEAEETVELEDPELDDAVDSAGLDGAERSKSSQLSPCSARLSLSNIVRTSSSVNAINIEKLKLFEMLKS